MHKPSPSGRYVCFSHYLCYIIPGAEGSNQISPWSRADRIVQTMFIYWQAYFAGGRPKVCTSFQFVQQFQPYTQVNHCLCQLYVYIYIRYIYTYIIYILWSTFVADCIYIYIRNRYHSIIYINIYTYYLITCVTDSVLPPVVNWSLCAELVRTGQHVGWVKRTKDQGPQRLLWLSRGILRASRSDHHLLRQAQCQVVVPGLG